MGKLGIYLLANYPSKTLFLDAVAACAKHGIDFIEVGFAFSDPVADGDVLENAAHTVLKDNTVDDFIDGFHAARRIFTGKLYIMTYANIVYANGVGAFARRVKGCDGLIIADLPVREAARIEAQLEGASMGIIRFVTPESRPEDVEAAMKGAGEFIYFISKRGTTGGAFELDGEAREKLRGIRGRGVDVCIGFGVQEREDVRKVFEVADGAIIGTRAVAELERGIGAFSAYIEALVGE
jgi:tryptophan synthase alpha chain